MSDFAQMIEQAPEAILVVGADGEILYANRYAAELFIASAFDLVGAPIGDFIQESLRDQSTEITEYRNALPSGTWTPPPQALARPCEGSEFPVEIQHAPIVHEGRCSTMVIVRDVSSQHARFEKLREARDAAQKACRMKGEFLSLVAHDLSQPMQIIRLALRAAAGSLAPSSECATLLALATSSVERTSELLKLLLEISRLDSATIPASKKRESVCEIFADIGREFAPLAHAKGLIFRSDSGAAVIETDSTLVRALLANLVANAVRYTFKGEVLLRCTGVSGGEINLIVQDTGIGIPSDELPSIFQEFKRLDEARQVHKDGFGLGLAIVRRLCTLLGVDLTVASTVGVGSQFCVTFPPNPSS